MTKKQETVIPIQWSGWDKLDELAHTYYEVDFIEDFGVFKKGESFTSISVDYGRGFIEAYDEKGEKVIKKQNLKFIPIE